MPRVKSTETEPVTIRLPKATVDAWRAADPDHWRADMAALLQRQAPRAGGLEPEPAPYIPPGRPTAQGMTLPPDSRPKGGPVPVKRASATQASTSSGQPIRDANGKARRTIAGFDRETGAPIYR